MGTECVARESTAFINTQTATFWGGWVYDTAEVMADRFQLLRPARP